MITRGQSRKMVQNVLLRKIRRVIHRRPPMNAVCIFTQEAVAPERLFKFITPSGHWYQYDGEYLAKYFLERAKLDGKFKDPHTNTELNAAEIRRLDRFYHKTHPQCQQCNYVIKSVQLGFRQLTPYGWFATKLFSELLPHERCLSTELFDTIKREKERAAARNHHNTVLNLTAELEHLSGGITGTIGRIIEEITMRVLQDVHEMVNIGVQLSSINERAVIQQVVDRLKETFEQQAVVDANLFQTSQGCIRAGINLLMATVDERTALLLPNQSGFVSGAQVLDVLRYHS
jgi:hypothetical protein